MLVASPDLQDLIFDHDLDLDLDLLNAEVMGPRASGCLSQPP